MQWYTARGDHGPSTSCVVGSPITKDAAALSLRIVLPTRVRKMDCPRGWTCASTQLLVWKGAVESEGSNAGRGLGTRSTLGGKCVFKHGRAQSAIGVGRVVCAVKCSSVWNREVLARLAT